MYYIPYHLATEIQVKYDTCMDIWASLHSCYFELSCKLHHNKHIVDYNIVRVKETKYPHISAICYWYRAGKALLYFRSLDTEVCFIVWL